MFVVLGDGYFARSLSVAVIKHQSKNSFRKERLIWLVLPGYSPPLKEVKGRNDAFWLSCKRVLSLEACACLSSPGLAA